MLRHTVLFLLHINTYLQYSTMMANIERPILLLVHCPFEIGWTLDNDYLLQKPVQFRFKFEGLSISDKLKLCK